MATKCHITLSDGHLFFLRFSLNSAILIFVTVFAEKIFLDIKVKFSMNLTFISLNIHKIKTGNI